MTRNALTFDAVSETRAGPKWAARWARSWPDYRAWFLARGGADGPSLAAGEAALARHMPELIPVYRPLQQLAGGSELAGRFLATWCPPRYLGGCSVAALADGTSVRLVRNYDLSPDLNEGLLLRSAWTGSPLMGMVEFLWGLSDGVNASGLAVALAYGGRDEVARGFGVTTILRYVLETCASVEQGLAVLRRVPSHMAYNVVLADKSGATAAAELRPGGGADVLRRGIATNHQQAAPTRSDSTRSHMRRAHLERLLSSGVTPEKMADSFLREPLFQNGYAQGFGTLFTAAYDPPAAGLTLRWPGESWSQTLTRFAEGRRVIRYGENRPVAAEGAAACTPDLESALGQVRPWLSAAGSRALEAWLASARGGDPDWARFGRVFAA